MGPFSNDAPPPTSAARPLLPTVALSKDVRLDGRLGSAIVIHFLKTDFFAYHETATCAFGMYRADAGAAAYKRFAVYDLIMQRVLPRLTRDKPGNKLYYENVMESAFINCAPESDVIALVLLFKPRTGALKTFADLMVTKTGGKLPPDPSQPAPEVQPPQTGGRRPRMDNVKPMTSGKRQRFRLKSEAKEKAGKIKDLIDWDGDIFPNTAFQDVDDKGRFFKLLPNPVSGYWNFLIDSTDVLADAMFAYFGVVNNERFTYSTATSSTINLMDSESDDSDDDAGDEDDDALDSVAAVVRREKYGSPIALEAEPGRATGLYASVDTMFSLATYTKLYDASPDAPEYAGLAKIASLYRLDSVVDSGSDDDDLAALLRPVDRAPGARGGRYGLSASKGWYRIPARQNVASLYKYIIPHPTGSNNVLLGLFDYFDKFKQPDPAHPESQFQSMLRKRKRANEDDDEDVNARRKDRLGNAMVTDDRGATEDFASLSEAEVKKRRADFCTYADSLQVWVNGATSMPSSYREILDAYLARRYVKTSWWKDYVFGYDDLTHVQNYFCFVLYHGERKGLWYTHVPFARLQLVARASVFPNDPEGTTRIHGLNQGPAGAGKSMMTELLGETLGPMSDPVNHMSMHSQLVPGPFVDHANGTAICMDEAPTALVGSTEMVKNGVVQNELSSIPMFKSQLSEPFSKSKVCNTKDGTRKQETHKAYHSSQFVAINTNSTLYNMDKALRNRFICNTVTKIERVTQPDGDELTEAMTRAENNAFNMRMLFLRTLHAQRYIKIPGLELVQDFMRRLEVVVGMSYIADEQVNNRFKQQLPVLVNELMMETAVYGLFTDCHGRFSEDRFQRDFRASQLEYASEFLCPETKTCVLAASILLPNLFLPHTRIIGEMILGTVFEKYKNENADYSNERDEQLLQRILNDDDFTVGEWIKFHEVKGNDINTGRAVEGAFADITKHARVDSAMVPKDLSAHFTKMLDPRMPPLFRRQAVDVGVGGSFMVHSRFLFEMVNKEFTISNVLKKVVEMDRYAPPGVYIVANPLLSGTITEVSDGLTSKRRCESLYDESYTDKLDMYKNKWIPHAAEFFVVTRCKLNGPSAGKFADSLSVDPNSFSAEDYYVKANADVRRQQCDDPFCFRCHPGKKFSPQNIRWGELPVYKKVYTEYAEVLKGETRKYTKVRDKDYAIAFEDFYRHMDHTHQLNGMQPVLKSSLPKPEHRMGRNYVAHVVQSEYGGRQASSSGAVFDAEASKAVCKAARAAEAAAARRV